jgi:hypothetical protein
MNMNVELTIKDKGGRMICENERYDFDELRSNAGFSNDERRCFLDLVGFMGSVTWHRGESTICVARV